MISFLGIEKLKKENPLFFRVIRAGTQNFFQGKGFVPEVGYPLAETLPTASQPKSTLLTQYSRLQPSSFSHTGDRSEVRKDCKKSVDKKGLVIPGDWSMK